MTSFHRPPDALPPVPPVLFGGKCPALSETAILDLGCGTGLTCPAGGRLE